MQLQLCLNFIPLVCFADTARDPSKWRVERLLNGHSDLASLLVQYYFGGNILRIVSRDLEIYYANELPDKRLVTHWAPPDINWDHAVLIPRDYLLSFALIKERYRKFHKRFLEKLASAE